MYCPSQPQLPFRRAASPCVRRVAVKTSLLLETPLALPAMTRDRRNQSSRPGFALPPAGNARPATTRLLGWKGPEAVTVHWFRCGHGSPTSRPPSGRPEDAGQTRCRCRSRPKAPVPRQDLTPYEPHTTSLPHRRSAPPERLQPVFRSACILRAPREDGVVNRLRSARRRSPRLSPARSPSFGRLRKQPHSERAHRITRSCRCA